MSKAQNYFIHAAVLIDVDGVSLNNLGKPDNATTDDNKVAVKSIKKGKETYPMVSGQAWRYWWREALALNGWELSRITKAGKNQFITEANPEIHPDDDIFGYMSAKKIPKLDDNGEEQKDKKGNTIRVNATLTRVSPLKNSILVAVSPTKILDEFCAMSRHMEKSEDGKEEVHSALYEKQTYSAILKGMFSLDLDQSGTFTSVSRSGFQNITNAQFESIKETGGRIIYDTIYPSVEKVRLANETRIQRISETVAALKTIAGGAKRSTNYASVKPDFIILAIFKGGNNPFDNIAIHSAEGGEIYNDAIKEAILDNKPYLMSDVYIGCAKGFKPDHDFTDIVTLAKESDIKVHTGSVNAMIDAFLENNIQTVIDSME